MDKFLSGKKPDKDLQALKELIDKASLKDIFGEVESVFGKEVVLGRNIKIERKIAKIEKKINSSRMKTCPCCF
ncbi:MAG: hypothetical protein SWO11_22330 [Thermodesulfobacteriota bacterium]|nr:hypothetical protein [Thermodesulfobacteriota bacterium]